MKRAEAEKLLGGYATGTLTESERRMLFEAALAHQDLFDALADEEALRELLADPAARAQLLAALAPSSELPPPKVVPFWRRPGVLGAAAGLIVATTAGLAVLRSPQDLPRPAVTPEAAQAAPLAATPSPEAKGLPPVSIAKPRPKPEVTLNRALEAPAAPAPAPVAASVVAPPPVPVPQAAGAPAEEARVRLQAESRRMEARDEMAKKAEAARPVAAMLEVAGTVAPAPLAKNARATGGSAPSASTAPLSRSWGLTPLPDGRTRVTVMASRRFEAHLLKRGPSGVEVLRLQEAPGAPGAGLVWTCDVRLAEGEILDLYLLDAPTADPAQLPEAGRVDGFRARIHPAAKKDAPR